MRVELSSRAPGRGIGGGSHQSLGRQGVLQQFTVVAASIVHLRECASAVYAIAVEGITAERDLRATVSIIERCSNNVRRGFTTLGKT